MLLGIFESKFRKAPSFVSMFLVSHEYLTQSCYFPEFQWSNSRYYWICAVCIFARWLQFQLRKLQNLQLSLLSGVLRVPSFKVNLLQKLAVSRTTLSLLRRHFTNWREERSNEHFTGTKLYTALMPDKNVENVRGWFHSAIVSPGIVH